MQTVTKKVTIEVIDKFTINAKVVSSGWDCEFGVYRYFVELRDERGEASKISVNKEFYEKVGRFNANTLKTIQMEIKFID